MTAGGEAEAAGEPATSEPPPPQRWTFRLEVVTASEVTRLAVCGNFQTPSWDLGTAHDLKYSEASGGCWAAGALVGGRVGGMGRWVCGCWARSLLRLLN